MNCPQIKKLERYCYLILLLLSAWPLEAKHSIPSAVIAIGSYYQEKQWHERLSFGVEFDTVMSSHLEYQSQDRGERFAITIDRKFPLSNTVSLLGGVGSTIWLDDKQNNNIRFSPMLGVGIRYDWSMYVSASLSYQYMFNDNTSELLKPSIGLALLFRPFNNVSTVDVFTQKNQILPKSVEPKQNSTIQDCKEGGFLRSFYFAHNQSVIDIQAEDVDWFQANGLDKLMLIGHTDDTGDAEYNQRLGLRRAEFVKEALVKHGVEKNKISTCSRGEEDVNQQKAQVDSWMFRRVDVYLNE